MKYAKDDDFFSLCKDGINNALLSIVLPSADVSHQVPHTRLKLLEVHLRAKTKIHKPASTNIAHLEHTCIEQMIRSSAVDFMALAHLYSLHCLIR